MFLTFEDGAYFPDSQTSSAAHLSERKFQEIHWNSCSNNCHEIRDEEGTWQGVKEKDFYCRE